MLRARPPLSCLLLAPCAALLSGCGAGLLIGGLAGTGGGGSDPPPPPAQPVVVTIPIPRAPLVSPPGVVQGRSLFVANYTVPSSASLSIELRAAGAVAPQANPLLLSVENQSSTVFFFEQHAEIPVVDPTQDIAGELVLLVGGAQVGEPLPFTLIGQRLARVDESAAGPLPAVVSVLGNTRLQLRVSARPNEQRLEQVQMQVGASGGSLQLASDVQVSRDPQSGDWLVSGIAPPSPFPAPAFVAVVDDLAGVSTVVSGVYYGPAVLGAAPDLGSTRGGDQIVLFGQGLAPRESSSGASPVPDFSRVTVEFHKGGRVRSIPGTGLRAAQSSFRELALTTPQSPDGRPGKVEVHVKVQVGVEVEDIAGGVFAYRHPLPNFGPRGALLDGAIVACALAPIEGSVPDLLVVSSAGGYARLELMLAEGNGMLSSFGPPIEAGTAAPSGQVRPTDVVAGDFDADGDADAVVVNAGDTGGATHGVLEGRPAPAPPLALSAAAPAGSGGPARAEAGDLDRDGRCDFVAVPTAGAPGVPRAFLSRAGRAGGLVFEERDLGGALAQTAPHDAVELADLDGDGVLDLAAVEGAAAMELVVAYGDGTGAFPDQRRSPLPVPGYAASPAARAVGVHALGGLPQALAVVLAGVDGSIGTPPCVVVLRPSSTARAYDPPRALDTLAFSGGPALVTSAAGALAEGGPVQLVVASAGAPALRLLAWSAGAGLAQVPNAIGAALEPLGAIHALEIGVAVSPASAQVAAPVRALFVRHQAPVAGGTEYRLSTWLAAPGPFLVPPDASLRRPSPVDGLALGRFSGQVAAAVPQRETRDLCVAHGPQLEILANDGLGGFAPREQAGVPGLLGATLATVALGPGRGQGAAFLCDDGRVGVLVPGEPTPRLSAGDLRAYASAAARGYAVDPRSRLVSADVDADGVPDLVVALVLMDGAGAEETALLLLRGTPAPAPGALPWLLPAAAEAAASTPAAASGIAVGDFAGGLGAVSPLEVALAFPDDGNDVCFYRYEPAGAAGGDRFVRSYAVAALPALIAGEQPVRLAAADFDRSGTTDLVVASRGDATLRLFLNSGELASAAPLEVNVAAFVENPSPPALPPGTPTAMELGDIDGDGLADVIVATQNRVPEKDNSIACYVGSGTGALTALRILPAFRTGNVVPAGSGTALRDADVFPALADVNGDGQPDLVLGWSTAGVQDRNVRVLFGAAR